MQQKPQQGQKISGKTIDKTGYIKSFKFLYYDPIYKEMSDKAKTLYSFLHDKLGLFKKMQEGYEAGELTRSYLDEDGNIFILADNSELEYILNASEPTVIKVKKELKEMGLLSEKPVKDRANRIYVLDPIDLSDSWAWIDEVKKIRAEKEAKAKAKRATARTKKKQDTKMKRESKKSVETRAAIGDLNILSYGDLNNLSYGDLNNLSKTITKSFKLKTNNLKYKINPNPNPIDIYSLNIPAELKNYFKDKGKELELDSFNIFDVQNFYKTNQPQRIQPNCGPADIDFLNDEEFCGMVQRLYETGRRPIIKTKSILDSWTRTELEHKQDRFDYALAMSNRIPEKPNHPMMSSLHEAIWGERE